MTSPKDHDTRCVASFDHGEFNESIQRVLRQDWTAYDLVACGDVTLFVVELCACLLVFCVFEQCQCMYNRVESPDLKLDWSCDQKSRSSSQKSSNGNEHHSVLRVLGIYVKNTDPHLAQSSLRVLEMPLTQVRWAESDAVRMHSTSGCLRLF